MEAHGSAAFPSSARHRPRKILAAASAGGHWIQLQRVMPAFEGLEVVYLTTMEPHLEQMPRARIHVVNDANRWDRLGSLWLALRVAWILLRERPDVVISTGAAPGCFAVVFGRLLGARTIWLDSLANVLQVSLSGRIARPFASVYLTQWPHLASSGGPQCFGRLF